MIPYETRNVLGKQYYSIIGEHSAVQICRVDIKILDKHERRCVVVLGKDKKELKIGEI